MKVKMKNKYTNEEKEYNVIKVTKVLPILKVCENNGVLLHGYGIMTEFTEPGSFEGILMTFRLIKNEASIPVEYIDMPFPAIIDGEVIGDVFAIVFGEKTSIELPIGYKVYWSRGVKNRGWGVIYKERYDLWIYDGDKVKELIRMAINKPCLFGCSLRIVEIIEQ